MFARFLCLMLVLVLSPTAYAGGHHNNVQIVQIQQQRNRPLQQFFQNFQNRQNVQQVRIVDNHHNVQQLRIVNNHQAANVRVAQIVTPSPLLIQQQNTYSYSTALPLNIAAPVQYVTAPQLQQVYVQPQPVIQPYTVQTEQAYIQQPAFLAAPPAFITSQRFLISTHCQ